jgi:lysyl-tRNA synthetase class 2
VTAGEVRSPGDAPPAEGERVRFGGRLLATRGASLVVADALGVLSVELVAGRPGAPLAAGEPGGEGEETRGLVEGDLLVVEGVWRGGRLREARVAEQERPLTTAEGGDVQRFLLGGAGRRLRLRARVIDAVRAYFRGEGFLEVETPVVVPSPGLDLHLDACEATGGYLITSPEYQMKRLLAGGLPRVFQLARCHRQGERGALHNPEFTMVEWYRAFAGYEAVMADTEALVRAAALAAGGKPELRLGERRVPVDGPFERITVAEAFVRHAGVAPDAMVAMAAGDEDTYFRLLVERVEPALAACERPVFLVDYPASQASLARRKPSDPRLAERFELYAAGVELCNGFGELTDPVEQRARLEHDRAERARRGLPLYPIDERFLDALGRGMPRAAGNALGLDRLVALAVGAPTIGEVQAFPAGEL